MTEVFHPRSDFLATPPGARLHSSMFPILRGWMKKRVQGRWSPISVSTAPRLRFMSASLVADHAAALAAEGRRQAGRADGRRHHDGWRPVRQGRKPQAADGRAGSKSNKAGIRKVFSRFMTFGESKTEAVMPDNAEWLSQAQLYRLSARRRATFLGQSHAGDGSGEAATDPRPGAFLSLNSTTCACRLMIL